MFEIVCVTNRKLCDADFDEKIRMIAEARPSAIVLREKDLSDEEYAALAEKTMKICAENGVGCILHGHKAVAKKLKAKAIHLPQKEFSELSREERAIFGTVGVSCHSLSDVVNAEKSGANYLTFGHVFETDCKKGVPPKRTEQLKLIAESVKIPVFAIGGITKENIDKVARAGACGAFIMSGFMTCKDAEKFIRELRNKTENI